LYNTAKVIVERIQNNNTGRAKKVDANGMLLADFGHTQLCYSTS